MTLDSTASWKPVPLKTVKEEGSLYFNRHSLKDAVSVHSYISPAVSCTDATLLFTVVPMAGQRPHSTITLAPQWNCFWNGRVDQKSTDMMGV